MLHKLLLITTDVSAAEVVVVVRVGDAAGLPEAVISTGDHLIEDVEVSLARVLVHNTRLLQEEIGNHTPGGLTSIK